MAFDRGAERARRKGGAGVMAVRRAGVRRLGVPLAACLVLLLAASLVGAVGRWLVLVAVAGLGLAVAEVALHRLVGPAFLLQRDIVLGELYARLPLEQALLLVYVVRVGQMSTTARAVVVVAVVAHQLLRMVHSGIGHVVERLAVPRALSRGLPGVRTLRQPSVPLGGSAGLEALVAATGLPALGLLWAAATGSYALVAPAAVAMVLVGLTVVAAGALGASALLRRPRGNAVVAAVQAAVLEHRPDVVLYSAGRSDDVHWLTSWLDTLDELGRRGRPALVVLRDPEAVALVPPATTPVVCLPEDRDVRAFRFPATRVALFIGNSPENYLLLRNPRLRSAFIGHGDSDKQASTSPVTKMYDEVWVAGETALARWVRADVGVRPEQVRIVGRPQVRRVRHTGPRDPGAPFSVLYAPTWEGFHAEGPELSLPHSGVGVVRRLLALDGVRVLYRPHPTTGLRDAAFARADQQVRAALALAGPPHAVVGAPTDVYTALNEADVLVTDVTSVISDFLASGKPYVVVNGTGLDDRAFRERFPSSAGATLVGRGGTGLEAAVADARGPDTMRAARERVRVQLIGPPTDDPVGLFAQAVDALGDTLGPRRVREDGHEGQEAVSAVAHGAGEGASAQRR